jgi:hypothetical protein
MIGDRLLAAPGAATGCIRMVLLLLLAGGGACRRAETAAGPLSPVSLVSELTRLANPAAIADAPVGTMNMISTFDRRGGNVDWADWRGYAQRDPEIVVAELTGPGCVRRIWMTNVPAREWRFYVDGETRPRFAGPLSSTNNLPPLFAAPLSIGISGGLGCYTPIPYAKSLRIAILVNGDARQGRPYYHVNYETFPAGTAVTSFSTNLTSEGRAALATLASAWRDTVWPERAAALLEKSPAVVVKAGARRELLARRGRGELSHLALRLEAAAGATAVERQHAMRDLVLQICYDRQAEPSVDVPLGDFFLNVKGGRRFTSFHFASLSNDVFVSRLPLPYDSRIRLAVRNDSSRTWTLRAAAMTKPPPPRRAPSRRRLHVQWRQQLAQSPGQPFTICDIAGPGHYAGTFMLAHGTDGSWMLLEGDESFQVDEAAVPAWHGTGLEDYFNGGWYYFGLFTSPLSGLTEKAAFRTAQFRMHAADGIPFTRRLRGAIEFGDANRASGYLSSAAYWYADHPAPAASAIPPAATQRRLLADQLGDMTFMCELLELELAGQDDVAEERCLAFAERKAGTDLGKLIHLRALAYRRERLGDAAVAGELEQMLRERQHPQVEREARILQWLCRSPTNACLAANANGNMRVYLDGRPVLTGTAAPTIILASDAVRLSPGRHLLAAEATFGQGNAWFCASLRGGGIDLATDKSWLAAANAPPGWPLPSPAATGDCATAVHGLPPFMNHWLYTPNAIVRAQHGGRYIYPSAGWPAGQTRYFWKTFEVASRTPSAETAAGGDAHEDLFRARWDTSPSPGKRRD